MRRNYARRHSQTRMMIFTEARQCIGREKSDCGPRQENLLSSVLVAGMICVMALNLVFLAAGMLLGQVIEY